MTPTDFVNLLTHLLCEIEFSAMDAHAKGNAKAVAYGRISLIMLDCIKKVVCTCSPSKCQKAVDCIRNRINNPRGKTPPCDESP